MQTGINCAANPVVPKSVTSGDIEVVAIGDRGSTAPSTPVSGLGTTFTLQFSQTATNAGVWFYTGKAASSGAETISITETGMTHPCNHFAELAGVASATVTSTASQTTSSTTMTWNQTVPAANSVVIALMNIDATFEEITLKGVGFSIVNGANAQGVAATTWARVLSSGTASPSFTSSNASGNIGGSIVLQ